MIQKSFTITLVLLSMIVQVKAIIETIKINEKFIYFNISDQYFNSILVNQTNTFCIRYNLRAIDCHALLERLINRYTSNIQLSIINSPKHLSIVPVDINDNTLRISARMIKQDTTIINSIHQRIRIRTTSIIGSDKDAKEVGQWTVATPIASFDNDEATISFDIEARTSHGVIGTTVLELQAGLKFQSMEDIHWIANAKNRIIFDLVPSSLPLPSLRTPMMGIKTIPIPFQLNRPFKTISISYVTSFSLIPNGQGPHFSFLI